MTSLWPWFAIAGLGALHGLSPANGWMFAAAWGVRAHDAKQARRALLPIAIGHAASIAIVATAFALGGTVSLAMNRTYLQGAAGALLVGAASYRLLRGGVRCLPLGTPVGHVGIALWSFLMATAHGIGMMLVPAFVPLCLADGPVREITASGSLALALAAVGLHTAAMLVTTGIVATGVCRGIALLR
ncbi:MAG TPA: hypothetical protein VJO99_16380 [Burkholderiaceae bacterium]|nr:hypothetical protein [Burkholderiaceae bacterium]